jgi:hypothetical protein
LRDFPLSFNAGLTIVLAFVVDIVLPDVLLYKGNPAFRGAVSTNSELTD